ncbi:MULTISPECIES: carbohydrate ABC transporter permease [Haloarcula]|uniref:carbohydrate ABC transporter permease n=1 Tax=Haloarcula TaxID=2237 RepID=UPI0023EDF7D3|nr:carbohydrate ABC transporter permease [Halomicroarcula sp. XH51]
MSSATASGPLWYQDRGDALFALLKYTTIMFFTVMVLVPLISVVVVSFWSPPEFFGAGPHIIPQEPTLDAWVTAFTGFQDNLINSALIATGTTALALLICIPGAYVFGRQEFPGKEWGFRVIMVALLFPYILLIIPLTDTWYGLGLFNTIPGVILAYQVFVTPFAIWILRDFFEGLPANLEEAAQVFGCSQWQAFYKVILPLSLPAVMATGFLAFLVGWNDFLFSNMLTTGTGPRPAVVTLYLQTVGGESRYWGLVMAQALIVGTPPTVLYMIARRHLTQSFAV